MTINRNILLCIPLSYMVTPPKDQGDPQVGHCEKCNCEIWVSLKKRTLKKNTPNIFEVLCGYCVKNDAKDGDTFIQVDITNFNIRGYH